MESAGASTVITELKQQTKRILNSLAPRTFGDLMSRRSNRYARRVLERDGIPALAERFVASNGLVVADGPFRGMRYLERSVGSVFIPKLVGCYESELHGHLERLLATPRQRVVDVGCAEGYYAVGLALRTGPAGRVFAFDTDPTARDACRRLADGNGVSERVIVGSFCDPDRLQSVLLPEALVVCDCEGYEAELLEPRRVPALRACDAIVELHEAASPGVTSTIVDRFTDSHDILLVDAGERDPASYPSLEVLPVAMRPRAISEYRGAPQQWAVLTARQRQR